MTQSYSKFANVFIVTLGLALASPAVLHLDEASMAFAKGKGGGGGGGGGGKDKGGGDDRGSSRDNGGKGKSASAPGRVRNSGGSSAATTAPTRVRAQPVTAAVATVATSEETVEIPGKVKNINAMMGALNAANASPQALANASPNSRVGRIAAYRDAVLAGDELALVVQEQSELLETLVPVTSVAELETLKSETLLTQVQQEAEIAALQTALADAGGVDATLEAAIADATAALDASTAALADLDVEIATAQVQQAEYDAAADALAAAQSDLANQRHAQDDALLSAANKPVNDDVIAQLHRLLGLAPPATDEGLLPETD